MEPVNKIRQNLHPFARFEPAKLGIDKSRELEWILTNNLGGYSSSTILGMNTRKYHGLLVSSSEKIRRRICLHKLDEEIRYGDTLLRLATNEYKDGTITGGHRYLNSFEVGDNFVTFLPGARWATKLWTVEGFSTLARMIKEKLSLDCVLAGSESDLALTEEITELSGSGT